jgi:hypothetical protein
VRAPRVHSTIRRQPLEEFFLRSWSVSIRCVSPTRVLGFTNFQFVGGELKRVGMNASRTGSSATVYSSFPIFAATRLPHSNHDQE